MDWHWTGTGHWTRALDTGTEHGLNDGEVAGQVRLDQGVGGVGGKAVLEEGDGLVVRWFDHSLSSRMMLSWLRLGGHWLLFSWSQQSSCDSAQLRTHKSAAVRHGLADSWQHRSPGCISAPLC